MAALSAPAPLFLQPVFGTMERDTGDQASIQAAIQAALEVGFRHLDSAERYETQTQLGHALGEAGVPREEVWLTSKLDGLPSGDYAEVKARAEAMLAAAQTDYFDLLLIHHPLPRGSDLNNPASLGTPENWEHFVAHIQEAWANMSRLVDDGVARHVGVSNFYAPHLDELAKHTSAAGQQPVFADQVFVDAAHPETELVGRLQAAGVGVMAYRPLAACQVYGFVGDAVGEALQQKATAVGADTHQELILRWLLARGVAPVSQSLDPAHMRATLATKDAPPHANLAQADGPLVPALGENLEMIEMYGGLDELAQTCAALGVAG